MDRIDVANDYFEWMFNLVCKNRYGKSISYRKLLSLLHNVEFTYRRVNDADRANDGIGLRHRFAMRFDEEDYDYILECLDEPCSVLEMILALAIRCEEQIMVDPKIGDRTGQWFWKMITNLGLGSMYDSNFDINYSRCIIDRFLKRKYEPDGKGGLFTVKNCRYDFRDMKIWNQLSYYLDTMI